MGGRQNRIALNHIIQRMHQIVQNQIQPQKIGRFLRNILRINHTFIFADGMGDVHQQRSRTGRRVVNVHAADLPAHRLWHQNIRHNPRHRVWRVVFGVFATRITIVVFNQVFKNRGEKIEFLRKNCLEAETRQFGNQRAAKIVAATFIGNILTDTLEQHDFRPAFGFYRKQLRILRGNIGECIVKELGKIRAVLSLR